MPEVLAIIPARGGSKGVPKKNSRLLDGKPLIAYSIETALASTLITDIVVNTDDDTITNIAEQYSVACIKRDESMAQDDSPVYPVIESSLLDIEKKTGKIFDLILLLQPTSPFRTGKQTDAAIQMILDHAEINGLISVTQVGDQHPSRMYSVDDAQKLHPIWTHGETQNRQSLGTLYIRNGAFYIARREAMLHEKKIMVENKIAFVMPEIWQVNIDTEKDFLLAELMVTKWKQQSQLS
jgi:CMP-N,N'-diacetyllegionaminic acid synthase